MTTTITVAGLVATGSTGQVVLTWDPPVDPNEGGLPYLKHAAIEIWAAPPTSPDVAPDRDTATKIGEQTGANSFTHTGLTRGQTFYYWVRSRNVSGDYGDWFPLDQTAGIPGIEANNTFLLATNGYFRQPNGLIEQWGFVTADGGGGIAITFPIAFPSMVFNFVSQGLDYTAGGSGIVPWLALNIGQPTISGVTGVAHYFEDGSNDMQDAGSSQFYWRANGV